MKFGESHQRSHALECKRIHVVIVDIRQQVVELLEILPLLSSPDISGAKLIRVVGAKLYEHSHQQRVYGEFTI